MANFNFNRVHLGGRLTADPELKQTQSGTSVCSFTVAINRRFGTKETDFIDCIAWKDRAEFLCKHFRKGASVCVIGSIQKRSWTDQHNQKRYATEIVVDDVYFVDSKDDNEGGGYQPNYTDASPANFENVNPDDDLPF